MSSLVNLHKKDLQAIANSLETLTAAFELYRGDYVEPDGIEEIVFTAHEANLKILTKACAKLREALKKLKILEDYIKGTIQDEKPKEREAVLGALYTLEEELQIGVAVTNATGLLEALEIKLDTVEIMMEKMQMQAQEQRAISRLSESGKNEKFEEKDQVFGDSNNPDNRNPEFDDDEDRNYRTAVENRPESQNSGEFLPRNPHFSHRDTFVDSIPNAQFERSPRYHNTRDLSVLNKRPLGTSTPYGQQRQVRYNLDDLSEQYNHDVNKESYNAIRPPQIKLTKFGGNSEEFDEFWAMFNNLVHKSQMSKIEKIIILKDCLTGKAALAIKGIKVVPENYELMVRKLKQKYENVKDNQAIIVKKLFDLPPAENKAEKCADTLDEIQALINQVTSSGYDIEDCTDPLWIETITKKFPYRILEGVLTENHDKKHITVGKFVSQLDRAIRTKVSIERCIGNNYPKKENTAKGNNASQAKPNNNSTKNFSYGKTWPTKKAEYKRKPCVYCGQDHKPKDCTKLRTTYERWNFVKENHLCANCLKGNHVISDCIYAGCPECRDEKHHNSLCKRQPSSARTESAKADEGNHFQRFRSNNAEMVTERPLQEPREIPNQLNVTKPQNLRLEPAYQSVLMTATGQVYNYNTKEYETALFFFDNGAQQSMIEQSLAEKLGIFNSKNKMETCEMVGFGGNIQKFQTQTVKTTVRTAFGQTLQVPLWTKKCVVNPINAAFVCKEDMEFMLQENIILANKRIDGELQSPQILIGMDLEHLFMLNQLAKVLPSGLRARRTIFGECLGGSTCVTACATLPPKNSKLSMNTITTNTEMTEKDMIKNLFELDQIGISTDEYSKNELVHSFYEQYKKSITFEEGKVIAPFPLKENSSQLADNFAVAWKRHISLCRVLDMNKDIKLCYDKKIQEYLNEGIIEIVDGPDPNAVGIYHMPHRGVWNPDKPKPLRVVFDASSKANGQFSLNEVIHTGEAFTNKIHDLLITIRLSRFILLCDVEAAFLQIRLKPEHNDLCRFMYRKDSTKPPTKDNVLTYRFTRLAFGINASPAILNIAIMAFLDSKNTELAKEIMNNLYVDNVALSADSEDELIEKYKESKQLFQEFGMNLREFVSNSQRVNDMIPEVDKGKSGLIKVLGVQYDTVSDKFFIETGKPPKESIVTKRSLLSELQSIYDPIGAVAPAIAHQKSLMREAMKIEGGWKTVLPEHLQIQWKVAQTSSSNGVVEIPRYVESETGNFDSIWIFADASQLCLAACVYFVNSKEQKVSSIISGKSKLSPLKQAFKIPRLELLSILLAHRLAKSISLSLKKEGIKIRVHNDSTVALCWIKNQRKLPIFVQNQVDRIKKLQSDIKAKGHSVELFHVETAANVADIATRGLEGVMLPSSEWVKGPSWIKNDKATWPIIPYENVADQEIDVILSEQNIQVPSQLSQTIKENSDNKVIEVWKYSNYPKLLQATTRLCKVAKLWLHKANVTCRGKQLSTFEISDNITAMEIEQAERLLILQDQAHLCEKELKVRFRDKNFFKDEWGVIRCDTRLQNSYLPRDTKQPILLVPKSHLTQLIVSHFHEECGHGGREHTLCSIRQRFWLPKPSGTIRNILTKCVPCKKTQGLPFKAPDMPSLPNDRVNISKPFQNTGLDFMGPIRMDNEENAYVCLYTCLTTRLIHLEVVENMSAAAFLSSFVRFSSRRGVPSVIRSDNGTNHVLGEKIIQHLYEKTPEYPKNAMNYFATNRIKWIFNPPSSPWMGGVWERLVGSVKRAAKKAIGIKKQNFIELNTLFTRIEAMINTRPLTTVDPNDIDTLPLRPVDFLNGIQKFSLPDGSETDPNNRDYEPEYLQTFEQTKESFEFSVNLANKFWNCWIKLYLTELRDAHKSRFKQGRYGSRSVPEVGEIVLIEKDNCPRGHWKYGKILELIESSDGKIRTVKVLKANHKVTVKPIIRLYPLEIRAIGSPLQTEESQESVATSENSTKNNKLSTDENNGNSSDDDRPLESFKNSKAVRSPISVRSNLVQLCLFMCLINATHTQATDNQYLNCSNGQVIVSPTFKPFKLCFEEKCKTFRNLIHESTFLVPRHSWNQLSNVTIKIGNYIENALCEPHHVCQKSNALLSKHLIGNPNCWPEGAVISAGIILLILFITLSLCGIFGYKKCKSLRKSKRNGAETIELTEFPKLNIPRALPLLTGLILLCAKGEACQEGYMRHSIDIKCNDNGKCHNDYRREILFNSIHKQMCVGITQNGLNVGKIKVSKIHEHHKCVKMVHFYTKDTSHVEFTAFRCPAMGSCDYLTNVCKVYNSSTRVPELSGADPYPGYFVCHRRNCLTQACPCGIPGMACEYQRVAHVPNNQKVYEVSECSQWVPKILLEIETQLYDKRTTKLVVLDPYVTRSLKNVNLTVISLQPTISPLWHKQYIVSGKEALIMPENYKLPVLCSTREQAEKQFSSCENTMICSCNQYLESGKCNCPPYSIKNIQSKRAHALPLFTKNLDLELLNHTIIATNGIAEFTLVVESKYIADSTELSYEASCDVTAGELVGCYNCIESARINLTCISEMEFMVIIYCENQQIVIECTPKGKRSETLLTFDESDVNETCTYVSNHRNKQLLITGKLHFHSDIPPPMFVHNATDHHSSPFDWFDGLNFPDLKPLYTVFSNHWKLTLATTVIIIIIAAITIQFGPMAILGFAQIIAKTFSLIAQVLWFCAKLVHQIISVCFKCRTKDPNVGQRARQ